MEKIDEVELLDKVVIQALLKCFEPVYQRALTERKWFRHEAKNRWVSPDRMKKFISDGECDTLMGWRLKYPQEAIEQLNYTIGLLRDKRERMANEIIAEKF